MKALLIISFVFFGFISNAQTIYYQDIFKGGVTGDGFNPAFSNSTSFLTTVIPVNSTIKKAFLICDIVGKPNSDSLIFNNTVIEISPALSLNYEKWVDIENSNGYVSGSIIIDVSNLVNQNQNIYPIIPPQNQIGANISGGYTNFYLIVFYSNASMSQINSSIYIDTNDAIYSKTIVFNDLNPIDLNSPVAICLNTDHFCDTVTDGSFVKINGINIGLIGGVEPKNNVPCAGVTSSFYYQNNEFFGFENDTPDNFMSGTDAIANISNLLTSTSGFDLTLNYQNGIGYGSKSNPISQVFLSYTSTCEAFPVTVSNDTTICRNETVQLSASGGTHYLWQPSTDLSCVYCPNPIFTGDSSRFYTVRIWNNDSCSVVRPVKVNVRQLPAFSSITSTPSACNGATGKIISSANLNGETYSLNGGTPQNSGNFFNLAPGDYTLSLYELNGCTKDTVITVGSTISTDAFFTATPAQGAPPLWVNFTNLSENASNYAWFLNGDPQGNSFPSHLFDSTGNYTVTLVAWPNNPSCTDTFSLQIFIFDSLIVQVPNVFTPNNDQSNDVFGITTNSPVTVEYQLFNRWGNEMISGKNSLGNTTPLGLTFTPLWDGNNATEGTYFYQLTITAQTPKGEQQRRLEGFFVLMR